MSVNYNEWVIYALVFLLGFVLGMALMAGGKWKRRYKEEARLRQEEIRLRKDVEAENRRLQKDGAEMDTLRNAAARDETHRRGEGPGPL
jgi:hypothetical protein